MIIKNKITTGIMLITGLFSLNLPLFAENTIDNRKNEEFTINQQKILNKKETTKKDIEIVFVLDTTGSMGNLIDGAKNKIWSIINNILQQNSAKDLQIKVGLVAYRDRGDDYITKVTPLSSNIDKIYNNLMDFQADGGGDTPEDVRTALDHALNKIEWSRSNQTSKIIFLVGDAPPHDDYQDVTSTEKTTAKAKEKGIIINTVLAGNDSETKQKWQKLAKIGGGSYLEIPQNGGVTMIETPHDEELAKLNQQLSSISLVYGKNKHQIMANKKDMESKFELSSSTAKADRAINKAINKYSYQGDLLNDIENNKITLKTIPRDDLPDDMQKMTLVEQDTYIKGLMEKRKDLKQEIQNISKKRNEFIKNNKDKTKKQDGFDDAVNKALIKQIN